MVSALWPKETSSLWPLTEMCGHGDGSLSPACLEERGSPIRPYNIHKFQTTHAQTGTHTNYTNYKITTGQLSATRPCYGKSSGCCVRVYLCVCLSVCVVEPLGSQGPCRALGVLIRQPQPSKVHHTEKERIEGRVGLNRG